MRLFIGVRILHTTNGFYSFIHTFFLLADKRAVGVGQSDFFVRYFARSNARNIVTF